MTNCKCYKDLVCLRELKELEMLLFAVILKETQCHYVSRAFEENVLQTN